MNLIFTITLHCKPDKEHLFFILPLPRSLLFIVHIFSNGFQVLESDKYVTVLEMDLISQH